MDEYTIVVSYSGVTVHDGKLPKSKLKYWSENVHIYVKGACPVAVRDKVHYHAMSLFLARHIPLMQVRSEGWV